MPAAKAVIHFDTSFLIQALVRNTPAAVALASWIASGEELRMSAVAWSEFLCGPLASEDRQLALTIIMGIEPFTAADAERSADLFNQSGRRSRSLADCQIAAVAMRCGAKIATANSPDFDLFRSQGLILVAQ